MSNVLVIGGGAREHCLAWKLDQSELVARIYVFPGNAGTMKQERNPLSKITRWPPGLQLDDFSLTARWCREQMIDMVVVGPEVPLAAGITDVLKTHGIRCFGPSRDCARIESEKSFAKDFMTKHAIPTARYKVFSEVELAHEHIKSALYPALVVKASGLAAGKGVIVAGSKEEACKAVTSVLKEKKFGTAGRSVVVEEFLAGEEFSCLFFCGGNTARAMPVVQDHKRQLEGDRGPNTGGMGAYGPCPQVDEATQKFILDRVVAPAIRGLGNFVGVLFAGVVLTLEGPKVLEFNCRFGDPECQVILPLLKSDFFRVIESCVEGNLAHCDVTFETNKFAVATVMASRGYPGNVEKGKIIEGIRANTENSSTLTFEAGTTLTSEGATATSGGRVLTICSVSGSLGRSKELCLEGVAGVKFGGFFRGDIADRGIDFISRRGLTYEQSGVNIGNGDKFVGMIAPLAASTARGGASPSLGGFGGLFDLGLAGYKDAVLVAGTDGVGTKLLIAQQTGRLSTIGVDLVAMAANDVVTGNAEPLFFLDYLACAKLSPGAATELLRGIADGCKEAGCALIGGETAEMPGLYRRGEFDLAGFCVGAYEKSLNRALPRIDDVIEGDVVVGVTSSGLHSNGFSLVREVVRRSGLSYDDLCPFDPSKSLGEALLTPTLIYSKQLLPVLRSTPGIKGLSHITGGGIVGNLPRVLPPDVSCEINAESWEIPQVFSWLARVGKIQPDEMLRTFNCGIGMCIVAAASSGEEVLRKCEFLRGCRATIVGRVVAKQKQQIRVSNFAEKLSVAKYYPGQVEVPEMKRKNVAVLISGSGSNLQALIDHQSNEECRYNVVLVVSNKPEAAGIQRAHLAGIKTKVVDHKLFGSRAEFEAKLDEVLGGAEFVCLAGFMRLLSGWFVHRWVGRIVNIHPSLLPSFRGAHAHKQAIEAGVTVSGCTAHFVVEEMDAGAIIAQGVSPVHHDDTVTSLQERVKAVEHDVYPKALDLVAGGKVKFDPGSNKVLWEKI